MAEVVDLDEELNFLWRLRGLPMTVMGATPYAPAAASSASRRVVDAAGARAVGPGEDASDDAKNGATTSWSLDPNTLRDALSTFTRGQ